MAGDLGGPAGGVAGSRGGSRASSRAQREERERRERQRFRGYPGATLQPQRMAYYSPPYADPYAGGYYAYDESDPAWTEDQRWASSTPTPSQAETGYAAVTGAASSSADPEAQWRRIHELPPPRTAVERAGDRLGLGWMRGLT